MSKDEGRLIVYLADPIIRVGKEYSPCALFFWCVHYLKFSADERGLKKNELQKLNFGKYSVNCLY